MQHLTTRTMRTFLLGLTLACAASTYSQFVLEHTYRGGSQTNPYSNQFFLIDLEASGWKYVRVDRVNMEVALYNLDHSFWKSVSFNMVTMVNTFAAAWDILYISEHLFDLDDGLEFMFTNYYPIGTPNAMTQVVDEENGGLIFNVVNQVPSVRLNVHQQQYPIRNTPEGTKLILTSKAPGNDSAYVYGLAGELSTQIAESWNAEASAGMPELFPNPATDELTLRVADPGMGSMVEVISDEGRVVLSRSLSTSVTTLNIAELAAGHYVCRLSGGSLGARVASFVKH